MKIAITDEEVGSAHERRGETAVESEDGTKFEKTITVNRPVAEVFSFWRRLENLPRFMKHLQVMQGGEGNASHWMAKVDGTALEWDAEIIEMRQDEMISWQSLPAGDINNAGSIWFRPAVGNRGTVVKVALKQSSGKKGTGKVSRTFGKNLDAIMEENLYRFKSLIETGEIPTTEGQPRGNEKL